MRLFAMACVISLFPASSYACGINIPAPGACSRQYIEELGKTFDSRSSSLSKLAHVVNKDKTLHIEEVVQVTRWSSKVESRESILASATPYAWAKRAEELRGKASDKEWAGVIHAWTRVLEAEAAAYKAYDPKKVCGLGSLAQSLAVDAGYIALAPVYIPVGLKVGGPAAGAYALLGPVAGAGGLAADVLTFVPANLHAAASRLMTVAAVQRSETRFKRFVAKVYKLEQKYG